MSYRLTRDYRRDMRRPPANRKARQDKAAKGRAENELEYVHDDAFEAKDAEKRFWGPDRRRIDVAPFNVSRTPTTLEGHEPRKTTLTPEEEKILFLRYNYAKYRMARLVEQGRGRNDPRVRKWRRRADSTREKLVHANLPLVPSMARRIHGLGIEFSDLISEGYMAVLRCVEKFDVSRGFKFSTYACRAILASYHRLVSKAKRRRQQVPVQLDPQWERSDYPERRHGEQRDSAIDAVREIIHRNHAELSPVERRVIEERFALIPRKGRRTLSEVGKHVGLSNERVRQIEKRALGKIREAFEQHYAA